MSSPVPASICTSYFEHDDTCASSGNWDREEVNPCKRRTGRSSARRRQRRRVAAAVDAVYTALTVEEGRPPAESSGSVPSTRRDEGDVSLLTISKHADICRRFGAGAGNALDVMSTLLLFSPTSAAARPAHVTAQERDTEAQERDTRA
jgi:hypothetical protein